MADVKEPSFTSERIKEGDTWSLIAYEQWGDANKFRDLIYDNPHLPINSPLPVGEIIYIRVLETPTTGTPKPPWDRDDDTLGETLGETDDAGIPVVEGPPVPLGFSPGYPKVEGNKIVFAINKNGRYPYTVEKVGGGKVAESSGYDFSSGFPVSTSDILEGNRYIVKLGPLVSLPLTVVGASAPLAFTSTPVITKEGAKWIVRYAINKTGDYLTRIVNKSNSLEIYNQTNEYIKDFTVSREVLIAGTFTLHVGSLSYEFRAYTETEVTEKPSWITGVGYRYDVNSHAFSKYVAASVDVEVRISLPNGTGPDGLDQDLAVWNASTYNPGNKVGLIAGYTEKFSFNAKVFGVGGLAPSTTYLARIRRTSDPSTVFRFLFTTPNASTAPGAVTVVDLTGAPALPACKRGPTIAEIYNPTNTSLRFLFDGEGVLTMEWEMRDSSDALADSGILTLVTNGTTPVFNPSNQPILNYAEKAAGPYKLRVRGGNCSSAWSEKNFTITGSGTGPVDPTPNQGDLELSLYYSQGGQEMKAGAMGGTPPYVYTFKNGSDVTIHTETSSANEVEIPDSVMTALGSGRLKAYVTDSANKQASLFRDAVTRSIMREVPVGISVANGDTVNHMNQINAGDLLHHNTIGVILGEWSSDAQMTNFGNTVYNSSGSSPIPEDNVVTLAKSKTYAKRLRIGLHMSLAANNLNNGTTRNLFYGVGALMKRPDGVTPVTLHDPTKITEMIPSPSSSEARAYGRRRAVAWAKHMLGPINDGTFPYIGLPFGSSAEAEYPLTYKDAQGQSTTPFVGDYHPEGMARFRTNYPQHASKTNAEIAAQFLTNTQLDLDYREHLTQELVDFEQGIFNAIYAELGASLTRDALEQVDVGSALDSNAFKRQTLNIRPRIRKQTLLFKVNDESNQGTSRVDFINNHASSQGMIYGANAMLEPSPQNADFVDATNRSYVAYMMASAIDRRVGVSFVHQEPANLAIITDMSGIVLNELPKEKQCFKIVGGVKTRPRLVVNVSDIFKEGGYDGWEGRHNTFKTAQGLTHVDTVSFDDLYVAPGTTPENPEEPDPGPNPNPGTGAITPKLANFGEPDHLNIEWSGSSKNWKGRDLSTVSAPQGYRIRYYIGGEVIIRDTPLTDYLWESNFPITFHKCLIKDGVNDLYFWGTNEQELRRIDDGSVMSGNVSMAYQTYIFNRL